MVEGYPPRVILYSMRIVDHVALYFIAIPKQNIFYYYQLRVQLAIGSNG